MIRSNLKPHANGATLYLVQRMHHGHVAQQRNREDLRQQVSAQQVSVELVLGELRTPDKDLGRQPVVLGVAGHKDGIVPRWDLLELRDRDSGVGSVR